MDVLLKGQYRMTAVAGLVSLVAASSLMGSRAEAGWRDYAYKHGAGSYIEKYVDKHVTEDNRYKGSKNDKWSGKSYDRKSNKWTGKTVEDEPVRASSKKAKSVRSTTSNTETSDTSQVKRFKKSKTSSVKASNSVPTTVSLTKTAKKPEKIADATSDPPSQARTVTTDTSPAYGAGELELYGPPMPKELEAALLTD